MNYLKVLIIGLFIISISCIAQDKPNIILIMADDMGYECLSTYGSTSYNTPVLDQLAAEGIQFNRCISQPLCTPSRVKIMTGQYNYRNYDYFGHLNTKEYTFGNMMQEAGYATCIAGKWQLNGLAYKDEILDWNDNTKPNKLGFDEYCLWQLTAGRTKETERFANPLIEQNGKFLERDKDTYGPDIFSNYILDFIERKKDEPFFVYYPMVLVHDPFVATPDSKDWHIEEKRFKNDTAYFKDMVSYTDKIVGKITDKLKELKIDDNTLVIFTGDNGTHPSIYSKMKEDVIRGAKGNTIDHGTHVPLIASWPRKIKKGKLYDGVIEFSDFFTTLADIVGKNPSSDGHSFYPLLLGDKHTDRDNAFVHYDPRWGERVNTFRNQFARTEDYKLYQDGKFYNLKDDVMELNALSEVSLSKKEQKIFKELKVELSKHPDFPK
jgi:arylsulfatase A